MVERLETLPAKQVTWGSIPGPGQTYVYCGKVALFCNPASGGTLRALQLHCIVG
jgi:hypothetical protein